MSTPNGDTTKIIQLPAMYDSCVTISGLQKISMDHKQSALSMDLTCALLGWHESYESAAAALMQSKMEMADRATPMDGDGKAYRRRP